MWSLRHGWLACMDAVVVCFPYQQGLSGSSQVSAHGVAAVWGAGPA